MLANMQILVNGSSILEVLASKKHSTFVMIHFPEEVENMLRAHKNKLDLWPFLELYPTRKLLFCSRLTALVSF